MKPGRAPRLDFIVAKLRGADGRLLHAWREGHPGARALLDDYASMARAALGLFEASGEPSDLEAARQLASEAIGLFGDGAGGFFLTAKDAADVPGARPRQAHDGATPSGVGLLAETFVRLWHLTDEARWGEAAEGLIRSVSGVPEGLGGSPLTLMSADMLARGGSVVIDGPARRCDRASAGGDRAPRARSVIDRAPPRPAFMAERIAARRPAARGDANRDAVPGQMCSLPVTTPEELRQALAEIRGARRRSHPIAALTHKDALVA